MSARLTRTPEETFQAGWQDGEHDAPLTPEELTQMIALHGPHLREAIAKSKRNAA